MPVSDLADPEKWEREDAERWEYVERNWPGLLARIEYLQWLEFWRMGDGIIA
jgi:hypothetical protein